jgi:hypothetical protein
MRFVLGGLAFLVVSWIAWSMFYSEENERVVDDEHCPECGKELPKQFQGTGECPYCALQKPPEDRPKKSRREYIRGFDFDNVNTRKGVMALGGTLGFIVFLSLLIFVIKRWRRGGREAFLNFRCPYCNRKLRYKTSQIGRTGLCPGCRRRLRFPDPVEVKNAVPS